MARAGRCYECFRPREACFCASIPSIHNQTEVLILQHRRERFHPFNTARIVHKALRNSRLLADHTRNLALRLRLKPGAGLLYPGTAALPVADLLSDHRLDQLVVLDGTWHHTKTLIRDIPELQRLPRYGLTPSAPGRFRIRREPSATSLSTVEAVVAALRTLEPATHGLDQLLAAFDVMVEAQLAHPGSAHGERLHKRRNRGLGNIPLALCGDLANIVVAYGESAAGERGCKRPAGPPICWVAQRLGSGETFFCTLIPPQPLDAVFLGHLALSRADFAAALPLDEARRRWARFQRPTDVVAVFHQGSARLYSHLAGERAFCLVLKSIELESTVDDSPPQPALPQLGIASALAHNHSRAAQRLREAIALVRRVNALAVARVRESAADCNSVFPP